MLSRCTSLVRRRWTVVSGLAMPALVLFLIVPSRAAESLDARNDPHAWADRPARGISVYTEYSRLSAPVGETVRMDLTVENRGRRDENVLVELDRVPKGWKASIRSGEFEVTGVPVTPWKPRVLSFSAEPPKSLRPGTYRFQLLAATADNALTVTQPIVVTLERRKAGPGADLQITTSYPVLRGPTDSSFEFSLEVANKADVDRIVNVAAEAPEGWEISIKPGYESKQITSLRIRSSASQTVALEVKPPRDAQSGEYPIVFRASTDRGQAETSLQVTLTGIYKLDATTPGGRLSLDAVVGKPTSTTLLVQNTGSALNRHVKFSSFAPENWKVAFSPETIEAIEPGAVKQVDVRITPSAQALVGDYAVGLTVDGEKSAKSLELRVTAHAPATWGWIGIGLVAGVLGGLGGLFVWLGRR